jgi:hypothetical protein
MGENRQLVSVGVPTTVSVLPHVLPDAAADRSCPDTSAEEATDMTTVLITYEVDDVQHWLASPTRTAAFESAGFTVRPFVDPAVANQVALLVEPRKPPAGRAILVAPHRPARGRLDDLRHLISSPEAVERMRHDGVRNATMTTYVASAAG